MIFSGGPGASCWRQERPESPGLALMMSGVSNSFSVEIHDTVAVLGAETWLVPRRKPRTVYGSVTLSPH